MSSFFPDHWTPARVDAAVPTAFQDATPVPGTNRREGRLRSEAEVLLWERVGKRRQPYPGAPFLTAGVGRDPAGDQARRA